MTKLAVTTTYTLSTDTIIDLPDGKTWDDVAHWHVKWGTLFLAFKGDPETKPALEIQTDEATLDNFECKRPDITTVRPVDEEGYADWSVEPLDVRES